MRSRPALGIVILVAVLMLGACRGGGGSTTTVVEEEGADAASVVADLIAAVRAGNFDEAAALTVTEQMPWVVMAEGASLAQAAQLGPEEVVEVAANYWRGFADAAHLPEEGGAVEEITVGDNRYAVVSLEGRLQLVLRFDQTWRVDVIASFAPTIANRLLEAAEAVEANRGDYARGLREMLAEQRNSVEVAARDRGLPAATREDLDALLEVLADLAS